ncbi:MAG: hypothetical protein HY898_12530 [Deltaproteobacteria bacterium]|nr:hypothetical protein [Deltaproteobacteria bacterium]
MAKAKAPQTQPAKTHAKAPAAPARPKPAPAPKAPPAPAEDPVFGPLWERFCAEANFNPETLELEASVIREEIAKLQERVAEKQSELDAITHREKTARDKMTALLKVGFSPEAVLSAMKVEFRGKKAAARVKEKEVEVGDDEKAAVLDVLDREGQPLSEVVKHTGRDPKDIQRVLTALVADGKVNTQGERKAKLFMLA